MSMTSLALKKIAAAVSSMLCLCWFVGGNFQRKHPVISRHMIGACSVLCLVFIMAAGTRADLVQAGGASVNDARAPRRIFIGQLLNAQEDGFLAEVEGRVTQVEPADDGTQLQLSVGSARLNVVVAERMNWLLPA